jgi:molybdopterin-guanine dinucleotide biosynthesis protein A
MAGGAGATPRAVVLTGGRSTRMGADKASLVLGGIRMVDRVLAACREAGLDAAIAGAAPAGLEAITLADPPGVAGPAAGLAAAMRAFPGVGIVLLATDQPYLRPATLRGLLATPGDAVAPVQGRRQTLCALYRTACAPALEALLAERGDPSLQTLLDRVATTEVGPADWARWGEDGRSWISLDTPDRWEAAAAAWPEPPLATIGR